MMGGEEVKLLNLPVFRRSLRGSLFYTFNSDLSCRLEKFSSTTDKERLFYSQLFNGAPVKTQAVLKKLFLLDGFKIR